MSVPACQAPEQTLSGSRLSLFTFVHYLVVMSDDDAARFRKQAEECREQAARRSTPLDKEAWLRVAEDWLKLASSAEGRRGGKAASVGRGAGQ
jgi:hypothetical protein